MEGWDTKPSTRHWSTSHLILRCYYYTIALLTRHIDTLDTSHWTLKHLTLDTWDCSYSAKENDKLQLNLIEMRHILPIPHPSCKSQMLKEHSSFTAPQQHCKLTGIFAKWGHKLMQSITLEANGVLSDPKVPPRGAKPCIASAGTQILKVQS